MVNYAQGFLNYNDTAVLFWLIACATFVACYWIRHKYNKRK